MMDTAEIVLRLRHPDCVDANCVKCQAGDLIEQQAVEIARLTEEVRWRRIGDHDVLADEVVRLNAEIARLRKFVEDAKHFSADQNTVADARAALEETPTGLDQQGPHSAG